MTTPALYDTEDVRRLIIALQEATRAHPTSGAHTYIPPTGGEIAEANYHHFVFGQRGSGKSSLLRHLEQQVVSKGRCSAWIDQEIFSNLDFPDVLVSVVHALLSAFSKTVREVAGPAPEASAWRRLRRLGPALTPAQAVKQDLAHDLEVAELELARLKFAPLSSEVKWTIDEKTERDRTGALGLRVRLLSLDASETDSTQSSTSLEQTVRGTKEQFLERSLIDFRDLLQRSAELLHGGFVFVDDLYQIKREVQPLVLGYMHRLVKDTGIFLKIGSIRYSTVTYRQSNPPRGMQVGHDAQEVALDRGLRHAKTTQNFLETILEEIAAPSGVNVKNLLTEQTRARLVLASGGVARDYLRLVSGAITEARNRGATNKSGSHRVIVEDVNRAAGGLAPSKLNELREDEPEEATQLETLVRRLTEFCRQRKRAYFLVATDNSTLSAQINKLQHLRFTHLLAESETVPNEGARRFNVWLLDVAELSAQRATQEMDFTGWESRERRRAKALIFSG